MTDGDPGDPALRYRRNPEGPPGFLFCRQVFIPNIAVLISLISLTLPYSSTHAV